MYNLQAVIRKGINNTTTQFERLGYVGNNFANYNTNGYKTVTFEQMLNEEGYLTGALRTNFITGSMRITNNPYDVAINGHGYMPVISEGGEVAYTRDGAFVVGKDGYLSTSDGWIVGEGIKINANCYKFSVKPNGDVISYDSVDDPEPKLLGKIPLVQFACPEGLEAKGNNKFVETTESGEATLVKDTDAFRQNTLETSNTNIYTSVNDMLRLNASMIASMRLMKLADDMYNKAINIRES